jgi:hypothetical protein
MGKRWIPSEDSFDEDTQALLGVFTSHLAAQIWISTHAKNSVYSGPDITGRRVVVDDVSSWVDVEGSFEGSSRITVRTIVTGSVIDW